MILRGGTRDDSAAIARLLRKTFRVSLPFLPELHTADEDLRFIRDRVIPTCTVWLAELDGDIVGFIAWREGWIDHLYVSPDHQGRGIGPRLLGKALETGEPRQLWTFQQNERALRFYEACGFVALEFTDGEGNEEKTPDVRYEWRPSSV